MKSRVVAAIVCASVAAAFAPANAQPASMHFVPVRVRVVDPRGKPVPNVLLRGCQTSVAETCEAVVSQAYADRDGFATLPIPEPAWPRAFRVELVSPSRSDTVVLYGSFHGCEFRFTQQYSPTIVVCEHFSRTVASAFQPTATTDTYTLGVTQIKTQLGKR